MPSRESRIAWGIAISLAVAWAVLAILAILVDFERHSEATALILVEGARSLGLHPVDLDVPVNEGRTLDVLGLFPGIWAIGQGLLIQPIRFLGEWLGLRFVFLAGAVFSSVGSLLVFGHALRTLAGPRVALLAQALFLALPAQWALSVYWQQCPNLLLLFGSLAALAAGRFGWYLVLSVLQATLHPLAAPVSLAVAWAALRAPSFGLPPLLPGLSDRGPEARRRFRIAALVLGGATLAILLAVAWRAWDSGTDGSLAWYFIRRKLEVADGEQWRNLPANLLYLLPMGFLPFLDLALLPAFLPLVAYAVLGTQNLVSALASLYLGVAFLAFLHRLAAFRPRVQATVLAAAILVALALPFLVPFRVLFPLPDGPPGGPLSAAAWEVPPRESAIGALVRANVPPATGTCVADFSRMPLMMERCRALAPLTYPGRRGDRGVIDFLERSDRGRLDRGGWQFLLVDRRRLAGDPALPDLVDRIDRGGRYEVAGEVDGVVLYRARGRP